MCDKQNWNADIVVQVRLDDTTVEHCNITV